MCFDHVLQHYRFSPNAIRTLINGMSEDNCANFWWGELRVSPTENAHEVDNIVAVGPHWMDAMHEVLHHASEQINLTSITCETDNARLNHELEKFPIYVRECDCFVVIDSVGGVQAIWSANHLRRPVDVQTGV